MASSDVEQPALSYRAKNGKSSAQTHGIQEPLLKNETREYEDFSWFPLFFPIPTKLSTAKLTLSERKSESATLSGISWYNLSSVEVGLITSGSLYGALIGSILAFNVADFLGRRRELILSSSMYLIGALVTALAPNFVIMVIGRFIYGIGIGLVGYISGSLLVETVAGWRYMYGVSSPLAVIMGIGMWWLPASPRWILLRAIQGKGEVQDLRDSAIYCLCRLRGEAIGDSAPQKVDEILSELSHLREEEEATIAEMFQITGQPSVLYYAATIFQSAGFSAASDATKVSILLGLWKLIMTGVAVMAVDRLGRRPLLLGGVSGIVISLFLLGSYYTYLGDIPAVAVVALLVYVGCYQLSFGPIGWLMISEVFPLRLRGRGLSIAVLVNFAANAVVTFAFSPLREQKEAVEKGLITMQDVEMAVANETSPDANKTAVKFPIKKSSKLRVKQLKKKGKSKKKSEKPVGQASSDAMVE
ncbi:UNVERIFIED_CONTAM: D-xylose-proton symporter-like 2 [Sesamum calycinum]|uniref:D-xylose-proton symporter-like 2 n=1 Tax=Sesamum calycinum TaxID=2727403 RepID=A0AAW2LRA6_9LAMI